DDGREEIADEDGPAGDLVEHPLRRDQDAADEEDLEGREEDHQGEDEERLPLGARDQQRADDAEECEGDAVHDRVRHDRRHRVGLAKEADAQELRRAEWLALDPIDREEPEGDDGRAEQAGRDAFAKDLAPGTDQGARERSVGPEEIPEHRDRREEVADEDRPPNQGAQHRFPERADQTEDEDLEAREQDDEGEKQRRLALADGHEARRHDAEGDERQTVDDGVAEDVAERGLDPGRIGDAPEYRGAQQPRGEERPAARDVEDEEPEGDDGRADQAGHDPFSQDRPLRGRHLRAGVSYAFRRHSASRAKRTPWSE